MAKINYKNLLIIGVLIILMMMVWINVSKKGGKITPPLDFGPTPTLFKKSEIIERRDYPEKIKWELNSFVAPERLKVYKTKRTLVDKGEVEKFLSLFGMSYEDKGVENEGIIFFDREGVSAYVNLEKNVFGMTRRVKGEIKNRMSEEQLRKRVEDVFVDFIPEGGLIEFGEVSYKREVYPRLVSSDKEVATLMEFEADLVVNGVKVKSEVGSLFKGVIRMDGEISKITIERSFTTWEEAGEERILSFGEVRDMGVENFKVKDVYGNTDYDLDPENEIKEAVIEEMELVYVAKGIQLVPYFSFEGKTVTNKGVARVKLFLRAI